MISDTSLAAGTPYSLLRSPLFLSNINTLNWPLLPPPPVFKAIRHSNIPPAACANMLPCLQRKASIKQRALPVPYIHFALFSPVLARGFDHQHLWFCLERWQREVYGREAGAPQPGPCTVGGRGDGTHRTPIMMWFLLGALVFNSNT